MNTGEMNNMQISSRYLAFCLW